MLLRPSCQVWPLKWSDTRTDIMRPQIPCERGSSQHHRRLVRHAWPKSPTRPIEPAILWTPFQTNFLLRVRCAKLVLTILTCRSNIEAQRADSSRLLLLCHLAPTSSNINRRFLLGLLRCNTRSIFSSVYPILGGWGQIDAVLAGINVLLAPCPPLAISPSHVRTVRSPAP